MTDQELIDATRRGEREPFGLLIQRYQRMVEAAAYGATGRHDLVDDIVQDTFITAWRTIDRLRDDASLRPWLYGIAKNLGLKARRRAGRTAILDSDRAPTPLDAIVARERDGEVATALGRLPRRYREPLVLFYYEQCSVREVAIALEVHEGAAMQRLSRGRRKLGEALASRVEEVLESKPTRAAVVAAVLLVLPARSASAATTGSASALAACGRSTGSIVGAAVTTATTRLLAARRSIGAVIAVGAATTVLVAGVSRSKAVAEREIDRDTASNVTTAPPAPQLPDPEPEREHDHRIIVTTPQGPANDDPGHVYRVVSIRSVNPFETCARGARAVAMSAFRNDAIHVVNGVSYYEPSAELLQTVNAAGERSAVACDEDEWPEVYVMCEGTIDDIRAGTITCYPHDEFRS